MGPYFCLRQRMLHFLQNFVYYMTVEVIKPRDHEMQVGLASARDMDEVSCLLALIVYIPCVVIYFIYFFSLVGTFVA